MISLYGNSTELENSHYSHLLTSGRLTSCSFEQRLCQRNICLLLMTLWFCVIFLSEQRKKKKKKSPSLFGVSQGWGRGDRGMGGRLQGCRLKHALNTEEPNRRRREETSRTWRDLWSDTQDVFEAVLKDGSVLYCVFGFGLQYTTYTLTYAALNPWDKLNYRR